MNRYIYPHKLPRWDANDGYCECGSSVCSNHPDKFCESKSDVERVYNGHHANICNTCAVPWDAEVERQIAAGTYVAGRCIYGKR